MQEIKIFIGSSAQLLKQRQLLSKMLYQLALKWMPSGIRIHVLMWETTLSTYNGTSMQEDYIQDLVLPSDICLFMFKSHIGDYTRRELNAKLAQDPDAVQCYLLPDTDNPYNVAVKTEIDNLCKNVFVSTNLSLISDIERFIESYVQQHLPVGRTVQLDVVKFYTTIPRDIKSYRIGIWTTMRELNDVSIEDFGIQCYLHNLKEKILLNDTDHYIPIFKEKTSDEDIEEFEIALQNQQDSSKKLRKITLFNAGNIYNNNQRVHDLISGDKDFFPCRFTGLDSLWKELHQWLRAEKKRGAFNIYSTIGVENNQLTIGGKACASVDSIDETGLVNMLSNDRANIDRKVNLAFANSESPAYIANLSTERNEVDTRLKFALNQSLDSWMKSSENTNELETKCAEIDKIVQEILSSEVSEEAAAELKSLLHEKESFVTSMLKVGITTPERLLSVQMMLVGVYDTYLNKESVHPEENKLFLRIITMADKYGLKDPNVEIMRMNYANSFARKEDFSESVKYHETAISNLEAMYDGSVMIAKYLTYLYTHVVNEYIQYQQTELVGKTLRRFIQHLNRLAFREKTFIADRCMYLTSEIKAISVNDLEHEDLVAAVVDYFMTKVQKADIPVREIEYDDVYIHMPNMLARHYIDRLDKIGSNAYQYYFRNAKTLLECALEHIEKLKSRDFIASIFHRGEVMHQLGFLYARDIRYWGEALNVYETALSDRFELFRLTNESDKELLIAQTMVNYSAHILNILHYPQIAEIRGENVKARFMSMAQQAKDIYKRHIIPGYPVTEQHYYEALQLFATWEFFHWESDENAILTYNLAMQHLLECWRWNVAHFPNEYSKPFHDFAGDILYKRRLISKEELDKYDI